MAVSKVRTSAGTILSIASAPATYDQAGFDAATFTIIGEVTDFGEFGRVYKSVTHNPVATRQTVKRKGSFDDGKMSLKMGRDVTDAGQSALIAARDNDASYSFKVVYQDGSINYFTAQVMSYTSNIGSVDQITAASVDIELDNSVIYVAAP